MSFVMPVKEFFAVHLDLKGKNLYQISEWPCIWNLDVYSMSSIFQIFYRLPSRLWKKTSSHPPAEPPAKDAEEPLPSPPFLLIPGFVNVRDIGGYEVPAKNSTNRSVRRGLIYRGGEPSRVTPEGREAFKALGVTKVFDIRTTDEIGSKKDTSNAQDNAKETGQEGPSLFNVPIVELEGTERIWLPVLGEKLDPQTDPEAKKRAYEQFKKNTVEVYHDPYFWSVVR